SFLQAGLVVSVAIILLAWATPEALASRPLQPVWDRIGEPWRKIQDRSARIFQDLNYQNQPPLVSMGDRRMWFGGPVDLADTPIADVQAEAGRYWRVLVFHDYASNGWLSTDPDTILLERNARTLAFPELSLRTEVAQTVTVHHDWAPGNPLIAAGQPLRGDLPMRAAVSMVTNEEDMVRSRDGAIFPPAPGDPSVLYGRELLAAGASYQVLSSMSRADEDSLRRAGSSYPNWVVPRYLQLPDSLPERVRLLAAEITAGQETAYDKAKAIESYLRKIPYNLEIEGPRMGQDGVAYFLFEEQQGYCDYYASAMVVMLRSMGVPARYVRGYIHPDQVDGVYQILESDGHAWPEVFFPGYGWVEFEPTGGRPELERSATPELQAAGLDRVTPPLQRQQPLIDDESLRELPDTGLLSETAAARWERLRPWAVAALLLGASGLVAYALFSARRKRRNENLSAAEQVYDDLVFWVRRLLRVEPLAHQTPNEYAGVVVQNVPRGRGPVERIVSFYVEERFGGKRTSAEETVPVWEETWQALWRR
ncbi:MAG TPA: transglutaminase domain-containing protein, partial [Anaerolineae bacterium]|nr:transglutaminase domain-containing protein [Anaerolineae bacterium]